MNIHKCSGLVAVATVRGNGLLDVKLEKMKSAIRNPQSKITIEEDIH